MSKGQPEKMGQASRKPPCEEPNALSIASRRQRLAKLLGRLLARHWLREKRLGRTQDEKGREREIRKL